MLSMPTRGIAYGRGFVYLSSWIFLPRAIRAKRVRTARGRESRVHEARGRKARGKDGGLDMAKQGKAKNKQREREQGRSRDNDDNIARITRSFRQKEHMSYPDQSHPGDKELVRHLRTPFKRIVLGGRNG
jgi:hypothetical protein